MSTNGSIKFILVALAVSCFIDARVTVGEPQPLRLTPRGERAGQNAIRYRLEPQSQIALTGGGVTYLTGRVSLLAASRRGSTPQSKRGDSFYALNMEVDRAPAELVVTFSGSISIPLFNGPGVAIGSTSCNLKVQPNGGISSCSWFLCHELEEESASEARIYRRDVVLDTRQESAVLFPDELATYPHKIELHLLVQDVWQTYQAKTEVLNGQEVTVARPMPGQTRKTVADLTLVGTVISEQAGPADR